MRKSPPRTGQAPAGQEISPPDLREIFARTGTVIISFPSLTLNLSLSYPLNSRKPPGQDRRRSGDSLPPPFNASARRLFIGSFRRSKLFAACSRRLFMRPPILLFRLRRHIVRSRALGLSKSRPRKPCVMRSKNAATKRRARTCGVPSREAINLYTAHYFTSSASGGSSAGLTADGVSKTVVSSTCGLFA